MAKTRRLSNTQAAPRKVARSVVDVILGEAAFLATTEERLQDMRAIASVILNRARRLHVTPEQVVSAMKGRHKQFDAYNEKLPEGVEKYRELAELAWEDVKRAGPITGAMYYATPAMLAGLLTNNPQFQRVGETVGHVYFEDPANKPIVTASDTITPAPSPQFRPRTQTPMYDAGQLGVLGPSAAYSTMAQRSLVGRTPADRFIKQREVGFWSNPAWRSYLFDFVEPAVPPSEFALPDHAPIPQPRPEQQERFEDVPIPVRRPDSPYPGALSPDPIDTRSIRGREAANPHSRATTVPAGLPAFRALREPSVQFGAGTARSFSPPHDLGRLLGQPAWDGAGLLDMAVPDPSATGLYGLQPAGPSAAAEAMLDGLSPAERLAAVASSRLPRSNLDYRMAAIAADPNLDYAALESNPTYMAPQTLASGATLGQIGPDGLAGKPQYGGGLAALWDPDGYAAEQQRMAEFERMVNAPSVAASRALPDRPVPVTPGYAPSTLRETALQDRPPAAGYGIAPAAASRFAPELEPVETNVRTTPKQGRLAAAPVPARFGRPAPDDMRYDYQTDLARLAAAAAPVPARFGRLAPEDPSYEDSTHLAGPATAPAPARFGRPAPEEARYDYQTDLARLAADLGQPPTIAAPDLGAPPAVATAPTVAAPRSRLQDQTTVRPRRDQFLPAPLQPSLLGGLVGPRMGGALLGASVAGLPGAIVGGLLGELLGGSVGGLLGDGGPVGPASAGERFDAGYGMRGIERGMYGPRGATGYSLSNPGSSVTSRGPGRGYDLTSGKYGWREHYDADGNFRGISYADGSGGLLGGLSRAFGGLLGGDDGSKSGKGSKADKDGLGVGLF